ncbi:MAG: hypothetical protein Q8Q10_04495 [bacterium]|nr:hypothetical protein [bacterium]
MATEGFGKYIESLERLIDKPPYLLFAFIGAVLVFVSVAFGREFQQIWIFFLYSVVGSVWRYIEKDIDGGCKKYIESEKEKPNGIDEVLKDEEKNTYNVVHLTITTVYHLGNIGLLIGLLHYLKFL